MSGDPHSAMQIRPATTADQVAALRLLFGNLSPQDAQRQIDRIVCEQGGHAVEGLWVGYRGPALVAAMLAQIQPGHTAMVTAPRTAREAPLELGEQLLAAVLEKMAQSDLRWAQALLEVDHGDDAELLTRHGFRQVSNLLYLVSMSREFPAAPPPTPLAFCSYQENQQVRLERLVEQTYVGSLDCPAIEGVRDVAEVLAGYRATGVFDPSRWIIASQAGADVGCVLLTDHPQNDQWELMYIGIVPAARGHGHGVTLTRYAQWLAARAGRDRLVLAVDAANEPALAMYAEAGFIAWDHRSVFLRML